MAAAVEIGTISNRETQARRAYSDTSPSSRTCWNGRRNRSGCQSEADHRGAKRLVHDLFLPIAGCRAEAKHAKIRVTAPSMEAAESRQP